MGRQISLEHPDVFIIVKGNNDRRQRLLQTHPYVGISLYLTVSPAAHFPLGTYERHVTTVHLRQDCSSYQKDLMRTGTITVLHNK